MGLSGENTVDLRRLKKWLKIVSRKLAMFARYCMTSHEGFCTLGSLCDLKHHRGENHDFLTDFPRCGQRERGESESSKSQF